MLLYEGVRAQHVAEKIQPALLAGKVVICERFSEATYAYQGHGRGLPMKDLKSIDRFATKPVRPDLTILFDLDPRIGLQKAIATADRISEEIKDTARRESEVLIKEARLKANKLLEQAQGRALGLEDRVSELKVARTRLEHRLRAVLEEHMQLVDHFRDDEEPEKIFVLQRPTSA